MGGGTQLQQSHLQQFQQVGSKWVNRRTGQEGLDVKVGFGPEVQFSQLPMYPPEGVSVAV